MSEKEEPVLSKTTDLKTPVYIRNATKAYYERKKDDPEFKKTNTERAKKWRQNNKEKHSNYQTKWRKKKEEKNQIYTNSITLE